MIKEHKHSHKHLKSESHTKAKLEDTLDIDTASDADELAVSEVP